MAPVLRDLTRFFQDTDWYLHLSSVSCAKDLCFSFDCTNYKRWLPIYYGDCLPLRKRFPKMYQSFLNGDFVVRQVSRKGSAVPMDQGLRKPYNKRKLYQKKGGCLQVERNKTKNKVLKLHEHHLSHG